MKDPDKDLNYKIVTIREYFSFSKQRQIYQGLIFLRKSLKGGLIEKFGAELILIAINIKSLFYKPMAIYIKYNNDKIVGMVLAFIPRINTNSVALDAIAVQKELRNQGFGKLLIELLEYELSKMNLPKHISIYLKTYRYDNNTVLSFYQKQGFIIPKEINNNRYIKLKKKVFFK